MIVFLLILTSMIVYCFIFLRVYFYPVSDEQFLGVQAVMTECVAQL